MFFMRFILNIITLLIVSCLWIGLIIFIVCALYGSVKRSHDAETKNIPKILIWVTIIVGIFMLFSSDHKVINHFYDTTYTSSSHIAPELWGNSTKSTPKIFFHCWSVDISSDDTYGDSANGVPDPHSLHYYVDSVTKVSSNVTRIKLDNGGIILVNSRDGKPTTILYNNGND